MAGVLRCDYYYVCCDVGKSTAFAISMILFIQSLRAFRRVGERTDESADQARRIGSNVCEFEFTRGRSKLVHFHVNAFCFSESK